MRREDWAERLADFVAARATRPFEWGAHDCATAAIAWVRAVRLDDPIGEIAPWRSARDARARILALGGLEAAVDARLERVQPAFTWRGDVGLVPMGDGPALVIVTGDRAIGPGASGWTNLPRAALTAAWRV